MLVGHNFVFISDMPQFFRIVSEQIILFFVAAIAVGWRSKPNNGYIPDLVAPLIICYGMVQFMMHLLVAYSS